MCSGLSDAENGSLDRYPPNGTNLSGYARVGLGWAAISVFRIFLGSCVERRLVAVGSATAGLAVCKPLERKAGRWVTDSGNPPVGQ